MERAGCGAELDGQFVEFLLLGALHLQIVGAAFLVFKTVERFAVARGDEHFLPDGVDFEAGLLEGGGAFLEAQLEDVAPGARAEKFNSGNAGGQFAGEIAPAGHQFLAGGFDTAGGLFAKVERLDVSFLRRLLMLLTQHAERREGELEAFHSGLFFESGSSFCGRSDGRGKCLLQERPALGVVEAFIDALAKKAVQGFVQRDGMIDGRIAAGGIGANVDKVLVLAINGQMLARRGGEFELR